MPLAGRQLEAHGIGGATDLPIPLSFAVVGAGAALLVSFVVLVFSWRTSRFTGDRAGRDLPAPVARVVDSGWLHGAVRGTGLLVTGYVGWAAVAGRDLPANPALGAFYIYLWVGLVPLSLLFGHLWPLLSPIRTLHLGLSWLLRTDSERGPVAYPSWLGCWPAAAGLLAFVWTELVSPDRASVSTVGTWWLFYTAVMLVGAAVFGTSWFARADPFEVWFGLVARLSPWGRRAGTGRPVLRNPLDNLDGAPVDRGLLAVLSVLLGSTAFDSFLASDWWLQRTALPGDIDPTLRDTVLLLGFVGIVAATFSLAAVATAGTTWPGRRALPRQLAHSLTPIAVGYVFAHYLTLLLEEGQAYLVYLSDPLVTGQADYLGTSGWTVVPFLSFRPSLLATLKVCFVVAGHVLGVIAAHDRAVRILPVRHAVSGQLAMLAVMLAYTVGGLLLLFSS